MRWEGAGECLGKKRAWKGPRTPPQPTPHTHQKHTQMHYLALPPRDDNQKTQAGRRRQERHAPRRSEMNNLSFSYTVKYTCVRACGLWHGLRTAWHWPRRLARSGAQTAQTPHSCSALPHNVGVLAPQGLLPNASTKQRARQQHARPQPPAEGPRTAQFGSSANSVGLSPRYSPAMPSSRAMRDRPPGSSIDGVQGRWVEFWRSQDKIRVCRGGRFLQVGAAPAPSRPPLPPASGATPPAPSCPRCSPATPAL